MGHTRSPEEYQALGRAYYSEKQYDKAIEAFTQAIEQAIRPTVEQYDQRAASFEKIKNFNAALKDGRQMIRVDQQDIKGYLRTGSILEKVGKPEKAIGIYKYGMERVPVLNKNFKILQQLHDGLTRKLSPPKALDPFSVLPVELAQMVALELPFKTRVNCIRVSRGWKNFLTRNPKLWTDVDLSGARKDVSRKFIRNAVNYSNRSLKRLVVHRFHHSDMLRNVATVCTELEELIFSAGTLWSDTLIETAQLCLKLKKLVVYSEITYDTVYNVLRTRPTLEHAEFHSIRWSHTRPCNWLPQPNLHTLHLEILQNESQTKHRDFEDLRPLLEAEHSPALKTLVLRYWYLGRRPDLSSLPLRSVTLETSGQVPKFPQTLERLDFKLSPTIPAGQRWIFPSSFDSIPQYLPKLTHLSLDRIGACSPEVMDKVLNANIPDFGPTKEDQQSLAPLQHFALRSSHYTEDALKKLFRHSSEDRALLSSPRIFTEALQILDLNSFPVMDEDIDDLINMYIHETPTLTNVHTVDLSGTMVTGAGVKQVVDHLPALKNLAIEQCTRISGRDIVSYAEKMGISVKFRYWTGDYKSGRKVRYG